jgi:hypothetical protein
MSINEVSCVEINTVCGLTSADQRGSVISLVWDTLFPLKLLSKLSNLCNLIILPTDTTLPLSVKSSSHFLLRAALRSLLSYLVCTVDYLELKEDFCVICIGF